MKNPQDDRWEIDQIFPDTPAASEKHLVKGAVILKLNGESVMEKTFPQLKDIIEGPPDSELSITLRKGWFGSETVTIKRAAPELSNASIPSQNAVGSLVAIPQEANAANQKAKVGLVFKSDLNVMPFAPQRRVFSDFPSGDYRGDYRAPPPPQLVGVGIVFRRNPQSRAFVVDRMYQDGPALRSQNVAQGDILVSVDQHPVEDMNSQRLHDLIAGREGSTATLGLQCDDGKYREVTLRRAHCNNIEPPRRDFSPLAPNAGNRKKGGRGGGSLGLRMQLERMEQQQAAVDAAYLVPSVDKHMSAPPPSVESGGIGVGIALDTSGQLCVTSLTPGGPADRSKLIKIGDIVKSVDSRNVAGCSAATVRPYVFGPVGTFLTLVVMRGSCLVTVRLVRSRSHPVLSARDDDAVVFYEAQPNDDIDVSLSQATDTVPTGDVLLYSDLSLQPSPSPHVQDFDGEAILELPDGDCIPAYEIESIFLSALPCVAHFLVFGEIFGFNRSILAALLVLKSSNNNDPDLPLSSEGLLLASQFNSSVTTCR